MNPIKKVNFENIDDILIEEMFFEGNRALFSTSVFFILFSLGLIYLKTYWVIFPISVLVILWIGSILSTNQRKTDKKNKYKLVRQAVIIDKTMVPGYEDPDIFQLEFKDSEENIFSKQISKNNYNKVEIGDLVDI